MGCTWTGNSHDAHHRAKAWSHDLRRSQVKFLDIAGGNILHDSGNGRLCCPKGILATMQYLSWSPVMARRKAVAEIAIHEGVHGVRSLQLPLGCFFQRTVVTGIVRGHSVFSKVIQFDLRQSEVPRTLILHCD